MTALYYSLQYNALSFTLGTEPVTEVILFNGSTLKNAQTRNIYLKCLSG